MTWLLSKLTGPLLGYVLLALVLITAAQSTWLWKRGVDLQSAHAALHVAEQDRDTNARHVTEIESARKGWEDTANTATAIIAKMQQDATDLAAKNADAIIAAENAQTAAEKSAAGYHGKFVIESKKPDCAHALAALQGACPNLSDY
jgi:hypothetical protein